MNIRRVAIIGPECTGKSELSQFLATTFNTVWVPEYAREYLDSLGRPYQYGDLEEIAKGQLRKEEELAIKARGLQICDTNLYVIKVWSMFKYGRCAPWILDTIASRKYDLYLLTYIDIPWQFDPLREHPAQREELYAIYLDEMKSQAVPYVEIKGGRLERQTTGINAIESFVLKRTSK